MSTYTTPAFWTAAAERALKTFAQTAVALLGVDTFGLLDVDWVAVASAAGLAALISLLTSIATAGVRSDGSPSLAGEVIESAVVERLDGTDVVAGPANDIVGEGAVVRKLTPEPSPELVRHGDEEVVVSEGYVGEHRAD